MATYYEGSNAQRVSSEEFRELYTVDELPDYNVGDIVRFRGDALGENPMLYKVTSIRPLGDAVYASVINLEGRDPMSKFAARFILASPPPDRAKQLSKQFPTQHRIGVPKNKLP